MAEVRKAQMAVSRQCPKRNNSTLLDPIFPGSEPTEPRAEYYFQWCDYTEMHAEASLTLGSGHEEGKQSDLNSAE